MNPQTPSESTTGGPRPDRGVTTTLADPLRGSGPPEAIAPHSASVVFDELRDLLRGVVFTASEGAVVQGKLVTVSFSPRPAEPKYPGCFRLIATCTAHGGRLLPWPGRLLVASTAQAGHKHLFVQAWSRNGQAILPALPIAGAQGPIFDYSLALPRVGGRLPLLPEGRWQELPPSSEGLRLSARKTGDRTEIEARTRHRDIGDCRLLQARVNLETRRVIEPTECGFAPLAAPAPGELPWVAATTALRSDVRGATEEEEVLYWVSET